MMSPTTVSLEALLKHLSPLGNGRFISMRPDKSCIMEATVDMSDPDTTMKCKTMPSGTTLLTIASGDKSFECHIDVGTAASAAITVSVKTGGPIVRISDAEENLVCTICLPKDKATEFESIRASLGDVVHLASGGEDNSPSTLVSGCRLVTGEELELELQDIDAPIVLDCFAKWCGPCQLMSPVMDEVATRLSGSPTEASSHPCRVLKMDTDEDPDMSEMLRVEGLPTILFIGQSPSGGSTPAVLHRFEGAAPADYIVDLANHFLYGIGPTPIDPRFSESC